MISFLYLCDPEHRADKEAAGQDPDMLIDKYAWMMHEAIKDRPDDMIIGMHIVGNFRSTMQRKERMTWLLMPYSTKPAWIYF